MVSGACDDPPRSKDHRPPVLREEADAIEAATGDARAEREKDLRCRAEEREIQATHALASARSSALEELYAHVDGMRTAELNEPKRFPTLVLDDVLRAIRALIKSTTAELGMDAGHACIFGDAEEEMGLHDPEAEDDDEDI